MKEKIKEIIVKNLKWIILFICLVGFLALAEDVFHKEIMNGDIIGYKLISTFLISDFATPIAKFITNFGGAIFLIALTIVLFALIKNKKIGLSIFFNLVIITVLNQLLKNILQINAGDGAAFRIVPVSIISPSFVCLSKTIKAPVFWLLSVAAASVTTEAKFLHSFM